METVDARIAHARDVVFADQGVMDIGEELQVRSGLPRGTHTEVVGSDSGSAIMVWVDRGADHAGFKVEPMVGRKIAATIASLNRKLPASLLNGSGGDGVVVESRARAPNAKPKPALQRPEVSAQSVTVGRESAKAYAFLAELYGLNKKSRVACPAGGPLDDLRKRYKPAAAYYHLGMLRDRNLLKLEGDIWYLMAAAIRVGRYTKPGESSSETKARSAGRTRMNQPTGVLNITHAAEVLRFFTEHHSVIRLLSLEQRSAPVGQVIEQAEQHLAALHAENLTVEYRGERYSIVLHRSANAPVGGKRRGRRHKHKK